jgi:hypothetical protein
MLFQGKGAMMTKTKMVMMKILVMMASWIKIVNIFWSSFCGLISFSDMLVA